MSNLTLDGSISFIGNEFIKLLATGSSNLATEEYVDDAIEQNGGGGGASVDAYTQTEVDNLLNNKLNVNNPQDIIGNLRLDPTNGNAKLIVNAVGAPNDEDFYVNGLSNLGGTLKAQLIQASSNIETSQQIKSNTINTYSNSNMVIQRNAIPYITLDSQIVDDETVEKIILMKDVEFSGGLSLNTLSVDTLNTVGLNDMVFNVDTLGEFLRFQVSDNTVRVPNTRSFLSQDIYLDNLRPLTFSNDVVFNGGNSTNDAYEEYVRLDASTEKVNISKNVDMNEDVIMKQTKVLYLDATANLQRYITTRNDNGQDILELVNNKATNNQIRFTNNGSTSLIVDSSFVFSQRQIQGNNGLKVDFIDTRNTNVDFQFRRSGATAITLKEDNEVQFSGYILVNNISTPENTDLAIRRSDTELIRLNSSNQIQLSGALLVNTINSNGNATLSIQQNGNSFISLFGDALNRVQINRFLRVVDGGGSTQAQFVNNSNGNYMEFRLGNHINAYATGTPINGNTLHLNYYSHGDVMLGTNQDTGEDPIPTISINKFKSGAGNAFEVQGNSVFSGSVSTNTLNSEGDNDLVISRNNIPFLTLDKFTEDTVEKEAIICSKQLRANTQLRVKNLQINQFPVGIEYADFRLENFNNSIMRFFVGNGTSPNLQISQYVNGSSETINEISLNRTTKCGGIFHTNTIDTYTDTDLLIKRNDAEVLRIRASDNLILTSDTAYFSSPKVYANEYLNRTSTYDTVFYGANSTSDGRVEYMKWNRADQSLDFNAPIDNTNIAVIGNIVDTTVSDERLKTNIQDVESNYCDCIKNVKIKTFEYKDEKYKKSDKYGFIAQHLQKHLPKEFDNIVKETKPKKDEGEAYLSINYMKLSVVLWGALQETLTKVEHLEASMYEMEDIKELKGKKTTKPKAKAKSKTKVEK